MSLLESVIGGVVGQMFGGRPGQGGAMSPLVKALLMLLVEKGLSGGLGGILGHGHAATPPAGSGPGGRDPGPPPEQGSGSGDIGGFGQYRGPVAPQPQADPEAGGDPSLPPGDFSDLSGMLGGGDGAPAQGQVSHETPGGLGALAARFEQAGLGEAMRSWIGPGANHPIAPDQLAHALGPETVDALQSRTGMDRGTLLAQLAQALPEVVDALTQEAETSDSGGWRRQ